MVEIRKSIEQSASPVVVMRFQIPSASASAGAGDEVGTSVDGAVLDSIPTDTEGQEEQEKTEEKTETSESPPSSIREGILIGYLDSNRGQDDDSLELQVPVARVCSDINTHMHNPLLSTVSAVSTVIDGNSNKSSHSKQTQTPSSLQKQKHNRLKLLATGGGADTRAVRRFVQQVALNHTHEFEVPPTGKFVATQLGTYH